jgi:predicted dehydrogenase
MRAGYHVLLEKPMATTPDECRLLVVVSEETGRQLHICHLLRYTRHFSTMRDIVRSGVLGDVIDVAHREDVAYWHMAHSYVRGNWRSKAQSSPMILAKCCHDLDILLWLLDRDCVTLSSTGSLKHFRPENAPPGAPARCLDGCPASRDCIYYAPWIYQRLTPVWRSVAETASWPVSAVLRAYIRYPGVFRALGRVIPPLRVLTGYRGLPVSALAPDPTPQNVERALREGPYGRCVYHCDNDVVDHQVVMMQFEGDISVTLTMQGHSHVEQRLTRIEGTRGQLVAMLGSGGSWIEVRDHRTDRHTRINTTTLDMNGHGGGDFALLSAFLDSLRGVGDARTTARQSLASHLLAFAAEESRLSGKSFAFKDAA